MLAMQPRTCTPTTSDITLVSKRPLKKGEYKKASRALSKDPQFQVHETVVFDETGTSVDAIAQWLPLKTIYDGYTLGRFSMLRLLYLDTAYTLAIPVPLLDKGLEKLQLPFPFSKDELALLYKMADAGRKPQKKPSTMSMVDRAEQVDLKAGRKQASLLPTDDTIVAQMLVDAPWLLHLIATIILASLRPFMPEDPAPQFLSVFVLPNEQGSTAMLTHAAFTDIVQACNVTYTPQAPQLVVLNANTAGELAPWRNTGCRLTLLQPGDVAFDKLEHQAEQITLSKCTHEYAPLFVAHPLLLMRSHQPGVCVDNINIPKGLTMWTDEQLDAIRSTIANLLKHPKVKAVELVSDYRKQMKRPCAYRISEIQGWKECAIEMIKNHLDTFQETIISAETQLNDQREAMEQRIANAIDFLLNPTAYQADVIAEDDKRTTAYLQSTSSVYTPGNPMAIEKTIRKKTYLCFRPEPLKGVLVHGGLEETEFDLVMARLVSMGVLAEKTTTASFRKAKNTRIIKLPLDQCVNSAITVVTEKMEA